MADANYEECINQTVKCYKKLACQLNKLATDLTDCHVNCMKETVTENPRHERFPVVLSFIHRLEIAALEALELKQLLEGEVECREYDQCYCNPCYDNVQVDETSLVRKQREACFYSTFLKVSTCMLNN
jgi:hypothetical protein